MILIAGLGNPGDKYLNSRHNLGWMVLDELVKNLESLGYQPKKWKFGQKFNADLILYMPDLVLFKPLTFMNASGIAVARAVNYFRVPEENLWLLHDDVDLSLGKLKIVKGRGSAGHRGVMSVIDQTGTIEFVRFRLGTGHPHSGRRQEGGKKASKLDTPQETEDFVLAPFSPSETSEVKHVLKNTVEALKTALKEGVEAAMNKYN